MILLALLACGGPDVDIEPTRVPPPTIKASPPAASGTLSVVVERGDDAPRTCLAELGGELHCPDALAGTFPGPSQDGRLIVVQQQGEAWRLGVYANDELTPWSGLFAVLRGPVWDGDSIVFEGRQQAVSELWRVRPGAEPQQIDTHPHGDFEPSVAPDGRIAFGTSRDQQAEVYVLQDGALTRITDDPADDTRPTFSSTGKLAWVSGRSGTNRLWVEGPKPLYEGTGAHAGYAWSPDGASIAAVVSDRGQTRVEVIRVADAHLLGTVEPGGIVSHPTWSPDGRWLAFTVEKDGVARVWTAHRSGRDARVAVEAEGASVWLPRWVGR